MTRQGSLEQPAAVTNGGENGPMGVGVPFSPAAGSSSDPGYDGGGIGYARAERVWCGETGVLVSPCAPARPPAQSGAPDLAQSNADGGDCAPMVAPVPPSEFRVQCSWCSRVMREGRGAAAAFTTHSICPACYAIVVAA